MQSKKRALTSKIVSPKVFRVHIKPEHANSSVVWRTLIQSFLIVPKKVWTKIVMLEIGWDGNYIVGMDKIMAAHSKIFCS